MRIQKTVVTFLIFFVAGAGFALEPDEILVIANSDVAASVQIAQYYCAKRKVPKDNILALPLPTSETIDRDDYEKQLAEPIRKKLSSLEFAVKIRCLLTTYGVPIKVSGRGPLRGQEDKLKQLKKLAEQEKNKVEQSERKGLVKSDKQKQKVNRKLARLQSEIDRIVGKETGACVDSELSMVLFGDYELYRWQPNALKNSVPYWDFRTLMVCRLDGPGERVAQGLVDKAIAAEKTTLTGIAYIDSRGIADSNKPYSFGYFDQSLRDMGCSPLCYRNRGCRRYNFPYGCVSPVFCSKIITG